MSEESTQEQREMLTDEEVHRRMMASPKVRARLEEVLAERDGVKGRSGPGLTTEELVEFLREHG